MSRYLALREILISNFKCFNEIVLPIAPLTVLSGYNGAGKSSAMQPLLLMAQAARLGRWSDNAAFEIPLNGELLRLGTVGDVLPSHAESISFEFKGDFGSLNLSSSAKAGQRSLLRRKMNGDGDWQFFYDVMARLVYLSAVRQGTVESFPNPDRVGNGVANVGIDGRFASYWYNELADVDVEPAKCCPDETAHTFRKQLDAWLGRLVKGAGANVLAVPQTSSYALQFRLSSIGEWRRPANVGYGLTYAFPIIVALLAARPGDILVVDSPEAHLHPLAQSEMGRMLATFAAAGVQILVETHSDHILNGIRLSVSDGLLPPSDLSLLFFAGASTSHHGVTRPRIDSTGRIDEWPDGFFDQSEKDIAKLAGWG